MMTAAELFLRCLKNDAWDCDDCPCSEIIEGQYFDEETNTKKKFRERKCFLCEMMVEEEAMNLVEVYPNVD